MKGRETPETLFKFASYAGIAADRVDATLRDGKFWFSHSGEFNDPYDTRPFFEPVYPDDLARSVVAIRDWYREQLKEKSVSRRARRTASAQLTREHVLELVDQYGDQFYQTHGQTPEIFCASATRMRLLLWSHYADQHRGVCIHLDGSRNPFDLVSKVKYRSERGRLKIPTQKGNNLEMWNEVFCIKDEDWRYEEEWRLIRVPGVSGVASHLGLKWNGQLATVPVDKITGLTLGAKFPDFQVDRITTAARASNTKLPICRARLHKKRYELVFESI